MHKAPRPNASITTIGHQLIFGYRLTADVPQRQPDLQWSPRKMFMEWVPAISRQRQGTLR